jgi:hypothetical protein
LFVDYDGASFAGSAGTCEAMMTPDGKKGISPMEG